MANLLEYKELPISEAFAAIERHKNNPAGVIRAFHELTAAVTNGEVGYVDATNPTVLNQEMVSVAFSAAMRENASTLRRTYPNLAETADQLADHASDWDMVNMFASPSQEPFRVFLSLPAFLQAAVRDEDEKCRKVIIPRDSVITGQGRDFTLHYPIVLRLYDVGNLEITYDTSIQSNFQSLETNIIKNQIVTLPNTNRDKYIMFTVPVNQVSIERFPTTTTRGSVFDINIPFDDKFYYARPWYRNQRTGNVWREMRVSFGKTNYDQRWPTMLLTVGEGQLRCRLPQIYMANDRLVGEIAIDVYTTQGNMNERLAEEAYEISFRNLDPDQNSIYTPQALSTIPRWAIPEGILTGGKNGLTFEQQRARIIHNSTGAQETPITAAQLEARAENNGFTISKAVDVVTERGFHAYQPLPAPSNEKLITSANLGIHTFIVDGEDLRNHPYVHFNENRWTMEPTNLYEYVGGVIRLLSANEINYIQNLENSSKITLLNSRNFLYTPFHYVYDSTADEFDLRAYYLDGPKPDVLSFEKMNETMQLVVNTDQREVIRTATGYQLRIKVLSGNLFKTDLPDSQVGVQLRFNAQNDETPIFIRGRQVDIVNGERVFAFDLETDFDINGTHALHILNVGINGTDNQTAWIDLKTTFHIFICTNNVGANYKQDIIYDEFGKWQFPEGWAPITWEKMEITLGKTLSNLWRRALSQKSSQPYQTYTEDKLKYFETDQYEFNFANGTIWWPNPETGRPEKKIITKAGDQAFDAVTGEPLYEYRKGDTIKINGVPQLQDQIVHRKEADILFIDGRHYFVTDSAYLEYNKEITDVLVDWITEGLAVTAKNVLEKTKIFLYPRSQIGSVTVEYGDGRIRTITAEQSPELDIYLSDEVYNDDTMFETIRRKTVALLAKEIVGGTLNVSDIEDKLRIEYGSTVISFKLFGFGDGRDIHYANVVQPERSLSLKRNIEAQADGALIMREDVTINRHRAKVNSAV